MKIMVTGGAGYIGSHAVRQLVRSGYEPVVFDSLVKGHAQAVGFAPLFKGDLLNKEALRRFFSQHNVGAVMHFAAHSLVGESMQKPHLYYENNVTGSMNLFQSRNGCRHRQNLFFHRRPLFTGSRTAFPSQRMRQISRLTFTAEQSLSSRICCAIFRCHMAFGIKALRYFNAAGADIDGDIGEDHTPETHLIPIILQYVLRKDGISCACLETIIRREDGTCVQGLYPRHRFSGRTCAGADADLDRRWCRAMRL